MVIQLEDKSTPIKSPLRDEGSSVPDQSPPPYSPPAQGSSVRPPPSLNLPPDLAPTNYLHVKEKNNTIKRKILLDFSVPPPPASVSAGSGEEDTPNLILDSHNGSVIAEVWLLSANRDAIVSDQDGKITPKRERVHLQFRSHNGGIKAQVHPHPRTVEPRPFLNIEAKGHNGSITVAIPRSFRGQLTLYTDNGRVQLSSALTPRAASLSALNGTHTYFVGERPRKWHAGESEDGDEVDELIASSKNGSIKVFYDDEEVPGVLSSLFKAMGF